MAILDVVLYPDDPLRLKAEKIALFGPPLERLAEDMLDTMYAFEGVGIAGPQVGVAQRIFVLCEPDGEEMVFVNPELSQLEGKEEGEEGCLSLPRVFAQVPRATKLLVKACDPQGIPFEMEATDFLARIIQHENDHLDGVIFLDRLDILTREAKMREWQEVRAELAGARDEG